MMIGFFLFVISCVGVYGSENVIVYGSTPSGIMAAIAAAGHLGGENVVLLSVGPHIGGMMSGGLGHTDTGGTSGEALIGGLALNFFKRVTQYYHTNQTEWNFEPHVAENIFTQMLQEQKVIVEFNAIIDYVKMIKEPNPRIVKLFTLDGRSYGLDNGTSIFIDATYEGDLLAAANVSFAIGREATSKYGENLDGVRQYSPLNQYYEPVSALDANGNLLPLIYPGNPGVPDSGDLKIQAYNFRLCLTKSASKIPITKPANYEPSLFELFRRFAQTPTVLKNPSISHFMNIGGIPNSKTDINNGGPMSTDCIGCSWDYPTGNITTRNEIFEYHKTYTQGLLWFLGNDPSLNITIRNEMLSYGYCGDEFKDNGYFPYQLYVRESRRLIGDSVFTQINATKHTPLGEKSIGCGNYNFDSHHVQRVTCKPNSIPCHVSQPYHPCCIPPAGSEKKFAPEDLYVIDEGDVQVNPGTFQIPYSVLLPKKDECVNLLVPVCASSSHIGYCCLRLEPQYMIMGHSSGTAAAIAFQNGTAVSDIDLIQLNKILLSEQQILSPPKK